VDNFENVTILEMSSMIGTLLHHYFSGINIFFHYIDV